MKKLKSIFTVVLLLSFLSSTLGVQVYKHYCGTLLESVGFYMPPNSCEDEGGEMTCSVGKETSCCDDELEVHQLKSDFLKTPKQVLKKLTPVLICVLCPELLEEKATAKWVDYYVALHIPDIPIYKRLQRYTLYA